MQINVFELIEYTEDKEVQECIAPLYKSNINRPDVVNLMLIRSSKEDDDSHYVLVRNVSRLFSSKTNTNGSKFTCPHCLVKNCRSQDVLDKHVSVCSTESSVEVKRIDIKYDMPKTGENIILILKWL